MIVTGFGLPHECQAQKPAPRRGPHDRIRRNRVSGLPLRSVERLDIPLDASPKYRERCLEIKAAIAKHGTHNTYYLYDAGLSLHLTNVPDHGMLEFRFTGTVLTDASDLKTKSADLAVELVRETCDWLTQPIVDWFADTVTHAVKAEFDLYIQAGDLESQSSSGGVAGSDRAIGRVYRHGFVGKMGFCRLFPANNRFLALTVPPIPALNE